MPADVFIRIFSLLQPTLSHSVKVPVTYFTIGLLNTIKSFFIYIQSFFFLFNSSRCYDLDQDWTTPMDSHHPYIGYGALWVLWTPLLLGNSRILQWVQFSNQFSRHLFVWNMARNYFYFFQTKTLFFFYSFSVDASVYPRFPTSGDHTGYSLFSFDPRDSLAKVFFFFSLFGLTSC